MNTVDTYTAGVRAAVDAYRADESVRAGRCAVCHRREKARNGRRCQTCIRDHVTEGDEL